MQASEYLIELLKDFEGYSSTAYQDSVGVWTIGYGTTHIDGKPVTAGMTCTQEDAVQYIYDEVNPVCQQIEKLVKVPLGQEEFDALVDFCYNLGVGAFKSSTLLKKLNAGDYLGASEEFLKWDHAGGRVLAGLTRRRHEESDLFKEDIA